MSEIPRGALQHRHTHAPTGLVINRNIENQLVTTSRYAPCQRDRRAALLVSPEPHPLKGKPFTVCADGWNGPPAELLCSNTCPDLAAGSCAGIAEHAEAMAIRRCVTLGMGRMPAGMEMVHGRVVDGRVVASRAPVDKTCKSCAVMMRAWGVAGIWLYTEYYDVEQWMRWSVADYYDYACGVRP